MNKEFKKYDKVIHIPTGLEALVSRQEEDFVYIDNI
jgi:hypothetical protein